MLKIVLRTISIIMFLVAVVFIAVALSNPTLGSVFYIGNIRIDADVMHAFYNIYAIIMISLFIASFFVKKK